MRCCECRPHRMVLSGPRDGALSVSQVTASMRRLGAMQQTTHAAHHVRSRQGQGSATRLCVCMWGIAQAADSRINGGDSCGCVAAAALHSDGCTMPTDSLRVCSGRVRRCVAVGDTSPWKAASGQSNASRSTAAFSASEKCSVTSSALAGGKRSPHRRSMCECGWARPPLGSSRWASPDDLVLLAQPAPPSFPLTAGNEDEAQILLAPPACPLPSDRRPLSHGRESPDFARRLSTTMRYKNMKPSGTIMVLYAI